MRDNPLESKPMFYWENIVLLDYVPEVLNFLNKYFKLVVASNAPLSDALLMKKTFQRAGIDLFEHYITSKELGVTKPDITFFNSTCKIINANPSECIYIGNDYIKDIISAKKAGLYTIWLNENELTFPFTKHADFIIKSISELPEIIMSNFITPSGEVLLQRS